MGWIGSRKRRFLDATAGDEKHSSGSTTLIGRGVTLEGDLEAPGSAVIAGTVQGSVRCGGSLQVLAGARVEGSVRARQARVEGEVEGPVDVTEKLELGSAARLRGELRAGTLAIAEGARVEGTLQTGSEPVTFREKRGTRRGESAPDAPQRES